jgi:hypothetical protein
MHRPLNLSSLLPTEMHSIGAQPSLPFNVPAIFMFHNETGTLLLGRITHETFDLCKMTDATLRVE